ncbi:MAG: hypothetical protein R3Y53_01990 [Bacillota bacterium]
MIRRYSELIRFSTFQERLAYLQLNGTVCEETFGFERYINQKFYRSPEWKRVRNMVIVRDNGCDLGCDGYDIHSKIIVHHMNPITNINIAERDSIILDPEYLIAVSHHTHNAIHFGTDTEQYNNFTERQPHDTCLWRHK